ncbi:MAG: aminomethyl-transferring glycine dehydrogenase subunit GcvPB [Chloroflexi bacterium]|nr:aminomethyl-transferring glycine dehydrogenase subunit GcvPB [Chloroflexota bacterium]
MRNNSEPTIFDLSSVGRNGYQLPESDVRGSEFPTEFAREDLAFPELSEQDVVRHYSRLSALNYHVDKGLYPLGSCTMKYNPKISEKTARLDGFTQLHPLQPTETVQGALFLIYDLQHILSEISGFTACSLVPAAGAQGEFCGVKMIAAHHAYKKQHQRKVMLIPDSAHGTNPATSAMCGYECMPVKTDSRGNIDLEDLASKCNKELAGIMITLPNTLGLFDENILKATAMVHKSGGLVYGDGANMNALLGIAWLSDLGFDVMHYNLHKTFSTPHGGGGPGAGAVCCNRLLEPYLPGPICEMIEEGTKDEPPFYGLYSPERTIGMVKAFYGHFTVLVRAYTYLRVLGANGLRRVAEYAALNANYLMQALKKTYPLPYDRTCIHEFVLDIKWEDAPDIRALDVAKRLMDFGYHPPTNYFPLIVHESLMIEPTETENKRTLDEFIEAMNSIAEDARHAPEMLRKAPSETPFGRMDEVKAARDLKLTA